MDTSLSGLYQLGFKIGDSLQNMLRALPYIMFIGVGSPACVYSLQSSVRCIMHDTKHVCGMCCVTASGLQW